MREIGYDGCTLCAYEGKPADEEPCKTCKRAMMDKYRRKRNGDVIRCADNVTMARIIYDLQGAASEAALLKWLDMYVEG